MEEFHGAWRIICKDWLAQRRLTGRCLACELSARHRVLAFDTPKAQDSI